MDSKRIEFARIAPTEDIRKLERRTKSQDKKIIEKSRSFVYVEECDK